MWFYEGMWGSRHVATLIRNLDTRLRLSASRVGRFNTRESAIYIHWKRDSVGASGGVPDDLVAEQITAPHRNQTTTH